MWRGPPGLLCRESSRHLLTVTKTSPRRATLQASGPRHIKPPVTKSLTLAVLITRLQQGQYFLLTERPIHHVQVI
jgi:hypothetical protein